VSKGITIAGAALAFDKRSAADALILPDDWPVNSHGVIKSHCSKSRTRWRVGSDGNEPEK